MDGTGFHRDPHERIVAEAAASDRSAAGRVRRVARLILDDPSNGAGIEALAARAAMSRRNFERVLHRVIGMTPATFVEIARVSLAQRLLAQTGLPSKAVAHRCGFGDDERMRRAFHRRLGMSPRAYAAGAGASVPPIGYGAVARLAGSNLRRSVKSTFLP